MNAGAGPLRVGLIGAGKISEQYLANMSGFPDLDVQFVADLIPERARLMADEFGVPQAGTVDQALARDDLELMINLTIPVAHADVATAVLAAGKHVWNEKPLTLDRPSGQALIDRADAAGLVVGCAPDTVLGPGWQTTRRMIEQGAIGRPLTATTVFQTPGPHLWHHNPEFLYQSGGGPLLDMAQYYLTALTQIFGSITGVSARGSTGTPTRTIGQGSRAGQVFDVTVPTYVTAIYDFESGGISASTFSFDSPLIRMGFVEIAGTEATLAAPDPNRFGGEIRIIKTGSADWETIVAAGVEGGRGIGVVDIARGLRHGEPHRASGRLGLHVLDAMLSTAESIEQRTFVTVGSRAPGVPALPDGWDPTSRTV
jgi:predicted dehydrogenase